MTRKIEQVRFAESAPKKKRVAAYARVSSGKVAMLHSLSAQVSYYSDYIQKHGWEYAGVYADEAITGTKDNRENFNGYLPNAVRVPFKWSLPSQSAVLQGTPLIALLQYES